MLHLDGRFLGGSDSFLDERIPFVAMRALPQQIGAAVVALQADVRIEEEHRRARRLDVALHQRAIRDRASAARSRPPGAPSGRAGSVRAPRAGTRTPRRGDRARPDGGQAPGARASPAGWRRSAAGSALRTAAAARAARRAARADRRRDRRARVSAPSGRPTRLRRPCRSPCDEAHVAEIQIGRRRIRILIDRRLEVPRRVAAIADVAAPRCRARSRETRGSPGCAAACRARSARPAACGCDTRPPTGAAPRAASAGRAARTGSSDPCRITSLNASSARSTKPPRLKSRPRHSRM